MKVGLQHTLVPAITDKPNRAPRSSSYKTKATKIKVYFLKNNAIPSRCQEWLLTGLVAALLLLWDPCPNLKNTCEHATTKKIRYSALGRVWRWIGRHFFLRYIFKMVLKSLYKKKYLLEKVKILNPRQHFPTVMLVISMSFSLKITQISQHRCADLVYGTGADWR